MQPGPKPKPTAIRKLEGNPGHEPYNEHEPQPPKADDLSPIDWVVGECEYMLLEKFPLHQVAKMIWEDLAHQLDRLGVLTKIDKGKFGRYCETFARWLKCKAFLDRHGETYPIYGTMYEQEFDEKGSPKLQSDGTPARAVCKKVLKQMKAFPQVTIYMKLSKTLSDYEAEFGIGAASRSRIQTVVRAKLGGEQPDDDHNFNYAQRNLRAVK